MQERASPFMNTNKSRRTTYHCSFCGKSQDQVRRLIAGPGGVYICDESVAAIADGVYKESKEQRTRCSFCGKQQRQVQHITPGPKSIAICTECIELCQEILKEEQASYGEQRESGQ